MNLDVRSEIGGAGHFAFEPESSYMRFVADQQLGMSFNYYKMLHNPVYTNVQGTGWDSLNSDGMNAYEEGEAFGLQCGDAFITSYQRGVQLLFGISMEFESQYDMS